MNKIISVTSNVAVALPACLVDFSIIVAPTLVGCCPLVVSSKYSISAVRQTLLLIPNCTNFRAGTTPAGGSRRKHSFLQKMDDTRTEAAEAQRGRGCERPPLWYCITVLQTWDKTLLAIHLQLVQRQIYPVVLSTGGKKRWLVTCSSTRKIHFNIIQLLLRSHSESTSF